MELIQCNDSIKYDFFISYASENKEAIAEPLYHALINQGFSVWYDKAKLTWGDGLMGSIDQAIANSRYGIVILSPSYFAKEWPRNELEALFSKQSSEHKVVLPIWHKITKEEISKHSPIMSGKLAIESSKGIDFILEEAKKLFGNNPLTHQQGIRNNNLEDFIAIAENDLIDSGWLQNSAYKEVLIYPQNYINSTPNQELKSLINKSTIWLKGWGGTTFPNDLYGGKILYHSDGLALIDNQPRSSYTDKFLRYWYINNQFRFFYRGYFEEDELNNVPSMTMDYYWFLMDIVRPVLFSQKLYQFDQDDLNVNIKFTWNGMMGRQLIILSRSRWLLNTCICSEDKICKNMLINRNSSLLDLCYKIASEIFWMFGWDRFDSLSVKNDINSLLDGVFNY